jgi:hypothetical protein
MLERSCQAQVAALSGGAELVLPPKEVCEHTAAQFNRESSADHMEMVWNAALSQIETGSPDYRT